MDAGDESKVTEDSVTLCQCKESGFENGRVCESQHWMMTYMDGEGAKRNARDPEELEPLNVNRQSGDRQVRLPRRP